MSKSAPRRNPIKAIRAHCLGCCGGSPKSVAECPSAECGLFQFRMGRNPFRAPSSEKQKARALENLRPKSPGGDDE